MELSKEEQFTAINYVKAITIILVVASHYPTSPINRLVPYMYHMPLFFFLGGMLFNHKKPLIEHYKKVLIKHFLYIVLTYVVVGCVALVINKYTGSPVGAIFKDSIYNTVSNVLSTGFSNNRYFLASWFLFAYFSLMLFAPFICRIIYKMKNKTLAGIVFGLTIGWVGICYTSVEYNQSKLILLNYTTQVLVGGMFFMIGFSTKHYIFKIMHNLSFSIIIILMILFYSNGIITWFGMSWSIYKLGYINTVIGALMGIYCIFYISCTLSKAYKMSWLEYIGNGSKDIMS
ncbi:acyltransferase, partial [Escherichia coli]|nr:acyltransferase [Escherichia coli]